MARQPGGVNNHSHDHIRQKARILNCVDLGAVGTQLLHDSRKKLPASVSGGVIICYGDLIRLPTGEIYIPGMDARIEAELHFDLIHSSYLPRSTDHILLARLMEAFKPSQPNAGAQSVV
jgi:hypothetical protein